MTVPPKGFENLVPYGADGMPVAHLVAPSGKIYPVDVEVLKAFESLMFIPSMSPALVTADLLLSSLQAVISERDPPATT